MARPTSPPRVRRRIPRTRLAIVLAAAAVIVVLLSLRGLAVFYTDFLWFGSVHLTSVWKGVLGAKVVLAVIFIAVFFIALWLNLAIGDRLASRFRPLGPEDELVRRFRDTVGPHRRGVRTAISLIFALFVGTGAAGQWNNWILFRNAVPFHVKDPQFHRDVGFYVFTLPFLSFLVGWAFIALVIVAIVTAISHYLNGGIRIQGPGQRVSPQVKAHLSLLLGLIALVKAVGYYLQRYELDLSTRGYVNGAGYTDVHAQLPALTLLIVISLAAFVLFIVNIRRQGWVLPVIGVGLWAFISVVVGAVYPFFIQQFHVQPAQNALESPYIQRNIQATRSAYKLTNVSTVGFNGLAGLNPDQLGGHLSTLSDVRLWDPNFALKTYEKLQDIRSYYQFNELALDRYTVSGQPTPAIVAVRQLNAADLPAQSWVNLHLQYTHGYGMVLSPANTATPDGNPSFDIYDVPPTSAAGLPAVTRPSVYFGLNNPGYVIADTRQREIDYQDRAGNSKESNYGGQGGVAAGSLFRRAAFSMRFGDINPLISNLVDSHSRVMFVRDIGARVRKAAPFLQFDSDPYPVVLPDGRIYWIQDAYTTTSQYPYSQLANTSAVNQNSDLSGASLNYVRNSVKVVVDAYNGSMKFYKWQPNDPILQAYDKAFPDLFTPVSQMTAALRAHLRYPEDIFTVQASMFGRYHITGAASFFNAGDAWDLSQDPGSGSPSSALATTASTNAQGLQVGTAKTQRMTPIYQEMSLPGDTNLSFNILEPYVPVSQNDQQQNLSAFLVAQSDPANYGNLRVYVTPRGQQVNGPALINSIISSNPSIAQQISLLDQHGSSVQLGSVLMLPIDQSIVYVRSLYTESTQNPLPQFKYLIAVNGNRVAMRPTLADALADVLGAPIPGLGGTPAGATPGNPGSVTKSANAGQLISQLQAAENQAQTALKSGDLGSYKAANDMIASLLGQLAQAERATPPPPAPAGASTTPPSTSTTTGTPGTTSSSA